MEQGTFEIEEVRIVEKILPFTDVFINIGANIGFYCCIAQRYGKYTVAFEPMESNLKYLYKNLVSNGWYKNIEVYPIALGNQSGLITIYGMGTGASLVKGWAGVSDNFQTVVPVFTLDILLGNRFDGKQCFFVVDIEGAEDSMLEGAQKLLLMQPKPVWMVEISITDHWPEGIKINPRLLETFQKFWEAGYEAWTANHELRLVTQEEIMKIKESGCDSILTYNFLFIEKGRKMAIFGE
jgi:FkbM family methyltransferase